MGKKDKDIKIVLDFIKIYCDHNHQKEEKEYIEEYKASLCSQCKELAQYAVKRRSLCPKDPKPACKKCDTPCYGPQYKEKIRKVMKFSGIHVIKKGRLDYLFHYFF